MDMTILRPAHREFLTGYIACALWSSIAIGDNEDNEDSNFLDANYDESDLAEETLIKMANETLHFLDEYWDLIQTIPDTPDRYTQAGHDLWLTRNRHGAGFWDRGLGAVGDQLTEAAHFEGERTLYVFESEIYLT